MALKMKKMNFRKKAQVSHKLDWKLSRLIGRNHLNIGPSSVTNVEDYSADLHVGNMERCSQNAWLNLELRKAYADQLRPRIV